MKATSYYVNVMMHRISGRIIWLFFISGITPNTEKLDIAKIIHMLVIRYGFFKTFKF
jgi:hypothetical protein